MNTQRQSICYLPSLEQYRRCLEREEQAMSCTLPSTSFAQFLSLQRETTELCYDANLREIRGMIKFDLEDAKL